MRQARHQVYLCGGATRGHRAHLRLAGSSGACALMQKQFASGSSVAVVTGWRRPSL